MTAKERAKNYRKRKNQYYDELETKCDQLVEENMVLKDENRRLREILSLNGFHNHLDVTKAVEDQKYVSFTIPKLIDKDPENFRLTQVAQVRDHTGMYGTERVKTIKSAFNVILDNVVPTGVKSYLALFNEPDSEKMIDKYKSKRK